MSCNLCPRSSVTLVGRSALTEVLETVIIILRFQKSAEKYQGDAG